MAWWDNGTSSIAPLLTYLCHRLSAPSLHVSSLRFILRLSSYFHSFDLTSLPIRFRVFPPSTVSLQRHTKLRRERKVAKPRWYKSDKTFTPKTSSLRYFVSDIAFFPSDLVKSEGTVVLTDHRVFVKMCAITVCKKDFQFYNITMDINKLLISILNNHVFLKYHTNMRDILK